MRNCTAVQAHWSGSMSGVRVCRFALPGRESDAPCHVPVCGAPLHFEVFYCLRGRLLLRPVGGEAHVLEAPGVFLLSDCGGLQAARCSGDLSGILVTVDAKAAGESLRSICAILGMELDTGGVRARMAAENGFMALNGTPWTEALFAGLRTLTEEAGNRYCVWKAIELLYLLCAESADMAANPGPTGYVPPEVWKVKAYIRTHLSEKITIQRLCRQFSVSPTLLKEGFRKACGVPVHSFLMEQRMRRARELLCNTALPVLQIAQAVGYEGISQFYVAFKRFYGVPPGQMRKMSETAVSRPL